MEKLPKGITGFWKIGKQPSPTTKKSTIKKIFEKFKSDSSFRTVLLSEPGIDNNYYVISLFSKKEKHFIGINSSHPFYCGIKNIPNRMVVEFYDLPDSITNVLNLEFVELKSDFLNVEIEEKHLMLLAPVEIEQIKYWKTEKIGNAVFNRYD